MSGESLGKIYLSGTVDISFVGGFTTLFVYIHSWQVGCASERKVNHSDVARCRKMICCFLAEDVRTRF